MEHSIEAMTVDGYDGVALACPDMSTRAVIHPELSMLVSSFSHRGEELLGQRKGVAAYAEHGSTMGVPLLHPWANRLSGPDYTRGAAHVRLDLRSPYIHLEENGLPIHGLRLTEADWKPHPASADGRSARVGATLAFGDDPDLLAAFPFPHRIAVSADLSGAELEVRVEIEATGDVAVPMAFGFHPYLAPPGAPRPEWSIETPVLRHAELDSRGIPTGVDRAVPPVRGPLRERTFDDLYTDLADPPVFSVAAEGRRIAVEFREGYHVAQIYAPAADDVIAFEPMTAPTNALVSGQELRSVPPGGSAHTRFAVRVD